MTNISKAILSICLFFSVESFAVTKKMRDLNQLANILMIIADDGAVASSACKVNSSRAISLMQSVKASLDYEIKSVLEKYGNKNIFASLNPEQCLSDCNCSLYTYVGDIIGPEALTDADKQIHRRLSVLVPNQSKEFLQQCAQINKNLCNSKFFKSIKNP